jgi:3-oxoisoapionate decarboxylase
MNRGSFLKTGTGLAVSAGAASISAAAQPPVQLKLGWDAFVLRSYGWKAMKMLDYTAELRLDTIQLGNIDLQSYEPAQVQKVRDHAAKLGITIDGAIGCICPTAAHWNVKNGNPAEHLVKQLRLFNALGSTSLHVYMGADMERTGPIPLEKHIEETVKVLRAVRSQALDLNVKIAVENHMDLQSWELKMLIEEAGRDFVGSCFDSGNAFVVLEDPVAALETVGAYNIQTHLRDVVLYEHPRGLAMQTVVMGDGATDFQTFLTRFRALCPQSSVVLEVLTGSPPRVMPYLEPDFWKPFPKARAADFARFLALAKKGHPFEGTMLIGPRQGERPPEYTAALAAQRRFDLERSLDYCSNVLGIGVRRHAKT